VYLVKTAKNFFTVFMLVLTLFTSCAPAFASEPDSDAGINITSNDNGITINPGTYPNLSNVSDAPEEMAKSTISKAKLIGQVVTAICFIICLAFFFINVTKLSTSGAMSFQRRQAITGILFSGTSLALFGGAWTVITFFWNLFDTAAAS